MVLLRIQKNQAAKQRAAWEPFLAEVFDLAPEAALELVVEQASTLLEGVPQKDLDGAAGLAAEHLGINDLKGFNLWVGEADKLSRAYETGQLAVMPEDIPMPPFDPAPMLEKAQTLDYPATIPGALLALMVLHVCEAVARKQLCCSMV